MFKFLLLATRRRYQPEYGFTLVKKRHLISGLREAFCSMKWLSNMTAGFFPQMPLVLQNNPIPLEGC